jgi:hypothetical protein
VDVSRQHLDGDRVQTRAPGGHHAIAGVGHGFGQRGAIAAIEPDRVAQLRRADHAVALAIRAVADHAVLGEDLRAALCRSARLFLPADDADMADHILHLRRRQDAVAPKAGIWLMRVASSPGGAVLQRLVDGGDIAAPQPVIVVEVG